jgi:2-C-methyl-D-erythritol 4-phosphate cytidylyltransferase/2-C-methyl-D-erythritol 2,4-cyclodiphosphate synthase
MGFDKLWLDLFGRPLWRWSLDALLEVVSPEHLVVVVPTDALDRFGAALPPTASGITVVGGGTRRSDSVAAGLGALTAAGAAPEDVVLVHDAARPALSRDLLDRLLASAAIHRAVVPVLPLADTVKEISGERVVRTVPRDRLMAAQTPQLARLGDLQQALADAASTAGEVTDEASALEHIGIDVSTVAGDPANRKVTDQSDVGWIRAILAERTTLVAVPAVGLIERTAIGFDAHRLGEGVPLHLGGMAFADEPRGLIGHSDGDAVLHALVDALLGAAGLGDVGTRFPPAATEPGVGSADLLRTVVAELGVAGWEPRRLDVAIVGARPAIAPAREEMASRIAGLLGIRADSVSIRGTTSDGLGFGGSEGIAAWVVAVIGPAETR